MRITAPKAILAGVAAIGLAGMLAACGTAPSSSSTAASSKYLPCIVSDSGGFNDHSFNQLGLQGVQQAAKKLGTSYKQVQSKTASDYTPNVSQLISEKCNIIVASGFNLVSTVQAAAKSNAKTDFAMIDDNSIKAPNVKPVVFNTNEAAFLGGYAAAAYSKTGVVATYGGQELPSVTIYMDGFYDGVQYYNKQNSKNVQVLGWNEQTQKGTFVGNFTDQNSSKTIATNFIDQKADVIVPVAGSLYQGAGAAIRSSGASAVLEGVDADVFLTDTAGYQDLLLTSILKNIQPTVATVVEQAASKSKFDNTQYVGTLKNNGVGLAPFHDFASKIPSTLTGQLAKIKAGLIDGSITAASPSAFKS